GERADPILILARAAGLSWTAVKHVLKVRPNGSTMAPAALELARESYDKLTTNTALRVLRFWQVRGKSAKAH
uniref:DUF2336 domain-containing protein n=1 Tax=Enterobacter hormaechei TaxID=158836 RepID=UPI0013D88612